MKEVILNVSKVISVVLVFSIIVFACLVYNSQDKAPVELKQEDELVVSLVEYLRNFFVEYDMPDTSLSKKIDEIKNGTQALHVDFDSENCYFVCAYYGKADDERLNFCCINKYTWVKFKNASDIKKWYKGEHYVVAFQINKASLVTDIVYEDAKVPDMEHFGLYTPAFKNGVNTKNAFTFDETFIYLNSSDKSNVYYSTSTYNNVLVTVPCVYLDNQYYLTQYLYTVYPDGNRSDINIYAAFGEYCDDLIKITDTEKYNVTDEKGITYFYGLIRIDDFVDYVKE